MLLCVQSLLLTKKWSSSNLKIFTSNLFINICIKSYTWLYMGRVLWCSDSYFYRILWFQYSRLGDWPSLHKENINATRTVQQVKANIREIDKTRKQINDEDLEEFDKKTESMKRDALQAIQDFIGSVETDMTQGTEIIMRQSQWSVTHFIQHRILLVL